MEIEELQGKISALDKGSKLLGQKLVSLVKNSENNMLEIISSQCIEMEVWGTGWRKGNFRIFIWGF